MKELKELYERITNAAGKPAELELPQEWNHYKREYVAILTGFDEKYMFKREFISHRTHFSSSGCNATLEVNEKTLESLPVGGLVETKEGSHKYVSQKIYRKEKNGWKLLAHRYTGDGYNGVRSNWEIFDGDDE